MSPAFLDHRFLWNLVDDCTPKQNLNIILYYCIVKLIQEKAGQPVKMGSGKRGHNLSLYVDPEQMEVLEEIRWRERQSMSSIVRRALEEYIKAHGAGNDTFRLDNWQEDPTFTAVPTLFTSYENWQSYVDSCSKKEKLKLLKNMTSKKDYLSARIDAN